MRKNVASQFVAFQAVRTTDGSAVTTGTPVCYYTIDGGTQGTSTNTAVHEGNGQWSLALTQAETNGNHIVYTFTLTGAVAQSVNVYPVGYDETAANLPSDVIAISGDTTAADNLEAACDGSTYNIGGGAVVAASVTGAVGSVTGNVGGNVAGSVASVTGNVGGSVASVTAGVTLANGAHGGAAASLTLADYSSFKADVSGLATALALTTVDGKVDTIAGYLDTEIAAIKAVTDALPDNGALTTITTHLTDIKGGTFSGATDSLEAIRNRGDAAWVTATSVTVSDKTGFSLASTGLDLVTAWTVDITGTVSGNSTHDAAAVVTALGTGSSLTSLAQASGVAVTSLSSAAITDIWSTDTLVESYANPATEGTPAQLLYMIQQAMTQFAVNATTITVQKLDKTTTAAEYTIDDADLPTLRTRAT